MSLATECADWPQLNRTAIVAHSAAEKNFNGGCWW